MSGARSRPGTGWALLVGGALLASGLGCASTSERGVGLLCTLPVEGSAAELERQPELWFSLLLHGYRHDTGLPPGALLDCTGTPVLVAPPGAECRERSTPGAALPRKRLGADDLFLRPVDEDTWLVWAVAQRFEGGEGLGPVAMVDLVHGQLRVRTLGALSGPATRATFRMERTGGTDLLVAEGETCPEKREGPCQRTAQLLPRRANRFFTEPLMDAAGQCQGPARVHLERTETVTLPDGWARTYQMRTTLSFGARTILAQEQLSVSERNGRRQNAPLRGERKAQVERDIQVLPDRMLTSQPSLWSTVAAERTGQ